VKPLLAATSVPNNTIYPSQPYLSEDKGTLVFRHPNAPSAAYNIDGSSSETTWSPEEILAQQLAYVKGLASSAANEDVKDLFMTVPSYFTQAQRRSLKDAAEVAGLQLTGIISEAGAVGLNYAMTRNFPVKEYHMIYDSGAMKTTATILSFETKELPIESALLTGKSKKVIKPKLANTTIVEVIAFDSEQDLGGAFLDERLREVLVDEFLAQDGNSGEDIRDDARALRKLWREASKVKQVLSANNEASANVSETHPSTRPTNLSPFACRSNRSSTTSTSAQGCPEQSSKRSAQRRLRGSATRLSTPLSSLA
jgi:hypoxia up-regulated 1